MVRSVDCIKKIPMRAALVLSVMLLTPGFSRNGKPVWPVMTIRKSITRPNSAESATCSKEGEAQRKARSGLSGRRRIEDQAKGID